MSEVGIKDLIGMDAGLIGAFHTQTHLCTSIQTNIKCLCLVV